MAGRTNRKAIPAQLIRRLNSSIRRVLSQEAAEQMALEQGAIEACREFLRNHPQKSISKPRPTAEIVPKVCAHWRSLNLHDRADEVQILEWLTIHLPTLSEKLVAEDRQRVEELLTEYQWIAEFDPLLCDVDILVPFSATRREIRHTRLLAHFIGDSEVASILLPALVRFLSDCTGLKLSNLVPTDVQSEIHEEIEDGGSVALRPDLTIRCLAEELRYSFFVEAKIDAPEGENQLAKYEKIAVQHPDRYGKTFFFFLTQDRRKPETDKREDWHPISWLDIAGCLRSALERCLPRTPETVHALMWISTILHGLHRVPTFTDRLVLPQAGNAAMVDLKNFLDSYHRF